MQTLHITVVVPEPGQELVNFIIGHMRTRGKCITQCAAQHKVKRQNARGALLGTWQGPKARAVRQLLIAEALGLDPLQTPDEQ